MKVKVELSASRDIAGLKTLLHTWETQYPSGTLVGVSVWQTLDIQLEMPPLTQVVPPQIIDGRGSVEATST